MIAIILGLLIGFTLLIWSADRFVLGAVGLAHYFNISPLMIGVVIIGFGTSAPELLISTVSAWRGNSGLAIGNALGSNIANIALILGVTALLTPLLVVRQTLSREFPVLFIATAITWLVIRDYQLTLLDAIILITALLIMLSYIATGSAQQTNTLLSDQIVEQSERPSKSAYSLSKPLLWTIVGLILLLTSSNILVNSSVKLAQLMGISDLVIGLTIVAIGTSLPELAASITGAIKHHTDLAIGNIVGSNIFNTLGVVGIPGLVSTYDIPQEVLSRDFPVVVGLTVLLFFLALFTCKGSGMSKISGVVLLTCFIAFQTTLYIQNAA